MSKTIIIVAILIIVGALLILWFRPPQVPKPIKIGLVGPLTGEASKYGIGVRDGAMLAIEEINNKGELKVGLVARDDKGDPEKAKEIARELVAEKEIIAIIGGVLSSTVLSAGPIFQENGLPSISPTATNPEISQLGDYIFRVCPSDTYQGKLIAEFTVQTLGLKKVAIFVDMGNPGYSKGLADVFKDRVEELEAAVVAEEFYIAGDKDFIPQLTRIKDSGAEALFIPGYYTEAALITQQAKALGFKGQIIGGDGFHAPELIEMGGRATEGVKLSTFFIETDPNPRVQEFVREYLARFGSTPAWFDAHAYDAMNIIAKAIEIGGASRKGLRQGLTKIRDFPGVTGNISFDENGDVIKDILVLEVAEGEFRVYR